MLSKLIKYDIQYGARKYALMAALTLGLLIMAGTGRLLGSNVMVGLGIAFAVMASVAFAVVYVVISVSHLYTQLCGRESYLSHSLPVSAHALVLSKLICILIWGVVTVLMLAVFWLVGVELIFLRPGGQSLIAAFREFISVIQPEEWDLVRRYAPLAVAVLITAILKSVTEFGLCVSLTNIPSLKERNLGILAGILSYLVGTQTLGMISLVIYGLLEKLRGGAFRVETADEAMRFMIYLVISSAIFTAAFYTLTIRITEKHKSI